MAADYYLVTARKYRPQTFGELVAQEHVAETLKGALKTGRLAHAYLFSGPRGVGKTSAARILAKAINCQTPLEQRPDSEPCRTCESCQSFEQGKSLNIIEIDAASNNSVEDVRSLRENVLLPREPAKKCTSSMKYTCSLMPPLMPCLKPLKNLLPTYYSFLPPPNLIRYYLLSYPAVSASISEESRCR